MEKLNHFCSIDSSLIVKAAQEYGTPHYLYDEQTIIDKCQALRKIPKAYGLTVRYAMKANSTKALLQLIRKQGLKIDASSLNEVRRATLAGYSYKDIMLTSQEVPLNEEKVDLLTMISQGLKYNVCSKEQLFNIADYAVSNTISLAIRLHPGSGSGESPTRNTGENYSCFGIHQNDLSEVLSYTGQRGIIIDLVHVHIGSGGDPLLWQQNVDWQLTTIEKHFPQVTTVSFGGGLKEARMPAETAADIIALGNYAQKRLSDFESRTNRKLAMEVEPGNYIMANAGYIVTTVIDKKQTGMNFIILDGGIELNARPLLYGSVHPFYVISRNGDLLSSEFYNQDNNYRAVVVGRCCETGDSQCLNPTGINTPRFMAQPNIGDYLIIGGAGAYCSSMAPMNYNSHLQAPEILYTKEGRLQLIRKRQSLSQMISNEL